MIEFNNEKLKSSEMKRLYKFAIENGVITLDDVMVIYPSKQYAKQIIEYFIKNELFCRNTDGTYSFIYNEHDKI